MRLRIAAVGALLGVLFAAESFVNAAPAEAWHANYAPGSECTDQWEKSYWVDVTNPKADWNKGWRMWTIVANVDPEGYGWIDRGDTQRFPVSGPGKHIIIVSWDNLKTDGIEEYDEKVYKVRVPEVEDCEPPVITTTTVPVTTTTTVPETTTTTVPETTTTTVPEVTTTTVPETTTTVPEETTTTTEPEVTTTVPEEPTTTVPEVTTTTQPPELPMTGAGETLALIAFVGLALFGLGAGLLRASRR